MTESPESAASANRQAVMLRARALSCERDDRLLFSDLNFALQEGQVLQVRGSNGSGKTTLLRIICGLVDAWEGELLWYEEPLRYRAESLYPALLYLGHRVGVNRVLTPLENLRWTCRLHDAVSDARLNQALADVGLRGFEESQCFTLSAGQVQRVALARLLVSSARLWILDEPFTTLDVRGVQLLESLLARHADNGGAVLVTTHHELRLLNLEVLDLG